MRLKIGISAILLLLTAACAQGVDTSSTATPAAASDPGATTNPGSSTQKKSLFSEWIDSNGYISIDLRQLAFNQQKTLLVHTATQQSCTCQATTQGTEASGSMQVSGCSGNFSSGFMNCSTFTGSAQYTLSSDNVLNFCQQSTGCITFR